MSYYYKCYDCARQFTPEQIEKGNVYLCPECGKANKNEPLHGVLEIEYDYENLRKTLSREDFLTLLPGKFWLYLELWPIDFSKANAKLTSRLSLPADTLSEFDFGGRSVMILDETRNPTLSYKDRASALVALKAIELGIDKIAAASTGNAGSSLAGICARLGLKSIIYVPKNIPEGKRAQIETYGAELVVVDGDYDLAFDKCLEDSARNNWYNRNTAFNPLTIEGKKSAAYDIFISLNGELPDKILVPVGDGVIISGIYKGFTELLKLGWIEKLPEMIAVQSSGSDALVRYLAEGKFNYRQASTVADSISAGAPRNLFMAAYAVRESGGFAIAVDDTEILSSQKEFIRKTGIFCEPSSAAAYAEYKYLRASGNLNPNSKVLVLITGNGLKDIEALK